MQNNNDNICKDVLEHTSPELIKEAEELFKEYPFDGNLLEEEEDFSVSDYDSPRSTVYITSGEKEDLAKENMPLVYYIVSRFGNTNIDQDELLSVALVGYEKALSKFNPTKNAKFSTFAYRCIQNEIFYFIRGEKKISDKTVSFNATISTDKNGNDLSLEETIQSSDDTLDDSIVKDETITALMDVINNHLTESERLIIKRRFGIGDDIMTQNELAKMVSMSQANISKKEKNILEKMKKILTSKYKIKNPIN